VHVAASVLCELWELPLWPKSLYLKLQETHIFGRTSLYQWSARRTGRYLHVTKQNTREEDP